MKQKRVLVIGAGGLFGEACCRLLKDRAEVVEVRRRDVDLEDGEKLEQLLRRQEFDVLINAAAISGLEACLDAPGAARAVNVEAPRIMAQACHDRGVKMVQISTDYVFDGYREGRWDEACDAFPINVYGKTKRAAEVAVMAADGTALVARVSWLFGRGRASFVDQVIDAYLSGESKVCIGDKFSVPNYCDDLVASLWQVIERDGSGILHLCCDAEPESWYSYGCKVIDALNECKNGDNKEKKGVEKRVLLESKLADASFFREPRPRYTAMVSLRLQQEFGVKMRSWEEAMRDYLQYVFEDELTKSNY